MKKPFIRVDHEKIEATGNLAQLTHIVFFMLKSLAEMLKGSTREAFKEILIMFLEDDFGRKSLSNPLRVKQLHPSTQGAIAALFDALAEEVKREKASKA